MGGYKCAHFLLHVSLYLYVSHTLNALSSILEPYVHVLLGPQPPFSINLFLLFSCFFFFLRMQKDIVVRGILQVNIRILKKEIDSHEMHTEMKAERKVLVSKYSPFLR